jgi:hypothetical protein
MLNYKNERNILKVNYIDKNNFSILPITKNIIQYQLMNNMNIYYYMNKNLKSNISVDINYKNIHYQLPINAIIEDVENQSIFFIVERSNIKNLKISIAKISDIFIKLIIDNYYGEFRVSTQDFIYDNSCIADIMNNNIDSLIGILVKPIYENKMLISWNIEFLVRLSSINEDNTILSGVGIVTMAEIFMSKGVISLINKNKNDIKITPNIQYVFNHDNIGNFYININQNKNIEKDDKDKQDIEHDKKFISLKDKFLKQFGF